MADLPNDTDVLSVLNTTRGASLEILRTEFVPTTNEDGTPRFTDVSGNPLYNASNIWYTSVPDVLCAWLGAWLWPWLGAWLGAWLWPWLGAWHDPWLDHGRQPRHDSTHR